MSYNSENSNEIHAAQNSIDHYQDIIDSRESARAETQAKIDRLIAVRDSIATDKRAIRSERSLISSGKADLDRLSDWKGFNHDSFMSGYCDILVPDYKAYCEQVDDIHDALNNEIRRLQNRIYEMDGALGWLRARLNDCLTWLDNLMN